MAQSTPLRVYPVNNSPISRLGPRSPLKSSSQAVATLSLQSITGTTTKSCGGLASHYEANTFAYCAGSAAVLATVRDDGEMAYRFFRAQPTASPVHPSLSFYNPATPTHSPDSRRRAVLPLRQSADERPSSYSSPRRIWGDEASSKSWSARERVKAATCLALSANGKFLAVGETGYCPRINIFSIMPGASSDIPLTILTEHSFGVRCVAFSPDSRWLATLGDANDGFLFIWSVNPKTGAARLYLSNKCTASVLDMAWCGNSLITVGIRYVKVWRVGDPPAGVQSKQGRAVVESDGNASPCPKTLSGRNSLLGCLVDSTFTCVAPISEHEAFLCTKEGSLCLLDDSNENQELRYLKAMDPPVQAFAVDCQRQQMWYSKTGASLNSESFENLRKTEGSFLLNSSGSGGSTIAPSLCQASPTAPNLVSKLQTLPGSALAGRRTAEFDVASTCLPNTVVSIDGSRNLRIEKVGVGSGEESGNRHSRSLPAYNGAVLGVASLPGNDLKGHYLTWSPGGSVSFWSMDGSIKRHEQIELEQPEPASNYDECTNELRLVRVSNDGNFVVSGDKLGVLQVFDCPSWTSTQVRAHSAEITDMALSACGHALLVVTSSRDRTLQLFQYANGVLEILQTFNDHIGTVVAVAMADDYLISASSDRTVIIRQRTPGGDDAGPSSPRYASQRVITLKTAPTSIAFAETHHVVVATVDRQISTFNIITGAVAHSFKAFDSEGEDAVTLSSLSVTAMQDSLGDRRVLVGFSSADKSIRLYDFDRGVLLARELGHTEGISDVAILHHSDASDTDDRKVLVSTGLDGLIMVWHVRGQMQPTTSSTPLQDLKQGLAVPACESDGTPLRESILKQPPLRKVLSKVDLVGRPVGVQQSPLSRDPSPTRLKRKTSRLPKNPRVQNNSVSAQSPAELLPNGNEVMSFAAGGLTSPKSPSPDPQSRLNLRADGSPPSPGKTRAPNVAATEENTTKLNVSERSPSPSRMPLSLPASPKSKHRPYKGRLRRPPSVPLGLNSRFQNQDRRKSMSCGHEFGSIGMASEQVCRTLQAYRRKIQAAPISERAQLEVVEVELLATIREIQRRRQENTSRDNNSTTTTTTTKTTMMMDDDGTRSR